MFSHRHYPSKFDEFSTPMAAHGFTLIELLVIVALVAMLILLAVPSVNSIVGSHSFTQGVYDIATLLELARSEAVTRRTYVWVGFQNNNANAEEELYIGAVYSRDGTSNSSAANLQSSTRVLHVKRVLMTQWTDLKSATRALLTGTKPESVTANSTGISFSVGPSQFSQTTITFTPLGQAMMKGSPATTDGYDPLMAVSVRQAHGATAQASANDAAIILNGATGSSKVLCLE